MNVTGLVDASTGAVVERYHYDPYGAVLYLDPSTWNLLGTQASAFENDYLYTGRRLDAETDLFYYRARYYDPILGRFISRDPIGYGDGPNLYQYVSGRPVIGLDPTGLEKCCGPEVTEWFARQLATIRDFTKNIDYTDDEFSNLFKNLKFEKAGLKADCGPINKKCKNTVTLCGKCINVTELGNISFGYGLRKEHTGVVLFGGLYAEVTTGRGFDSLADVTSALAGTYLTNIANTEEMCKQLTSPKIPNIWGQGRILMRVDGMNDRYWIYSFGTDILDTWNKKHGDWEQFLTDALQHFNPDQQYTHPSMRKEPKSLWDAIAVDDCPVVKDCELPSDAKNLSIGKDGSVSWK